MYTAHETETNIELIYLWLSKVLPLPVAKFVSLNAYIIMFTQLKNLLI